MKLLLLTYIFSDPFATFGNDGLGNNGFEVSLNYISGIPDVNVLSDSNLKIIFKSLLKKDETTKERLLLDFLKILNDDSKSFLVNDDLVIISWVQLYPKLAIDVSKNVRLNSHQVQSKFVKILAKRYAKYLKDTAPIWLAGIFDTERLVSRGVVTSLTEAFQTQAKVDLLWKLFYEQILNFCHQVIKYESQDTLSDERNVGKDEATAKYTRVLLSTINVLSKLTSSLDIPVSSSDSYKKILKLEELWEISTTKDMNLKKSFLMFVITLLKAVPELIDDKLFKTISKSVVKSLRYKPVTNNIVYSLIALPTLSCILNLANFSPTFWDLGGKRTKEKFFLFLDLGSCSSSEIYYELLEKILSTIPDLIIDYKSPQDFDSVFKILSKDIEQEKLLPFKKKAWFCFFSVVGKFFDQQPDTVQETLTPFVTKQLHTRLSKDVLQCFILFYKSLKGFDEIANAVIGSMPNKKYNKEFVANVFEILSALKIETFNIVVKEAFDSLEQIDEEGDDYEPPYPCFIIFEKIITNNVTSYKQNIDDLVDHLASFVEKNFIEEPLSLLISYNNNKHFLDANILNESFSSVFNKLLMIDENLVPLALAKLPKLTNINIESCPDVQSFIVDRSGNIDYVDSSKRRLIFNFLTKDVFINLFKQSVESSSESTFVTEFLSKFDIQILRDFLHSGDSTVSLFFNYIFRTINDPNSLKLLEAIEKEDDVVFIENLNLYVSKYPFVEIDEIVSYLINSDSAMKFIPQSTKSLESEIYLAIGDSVDLKLTIANPLEANVLFASSGTSSFNFENSLALILHGRFLMKLMSSSSVDLKDHFQLVFTLAVIGEIASDYCFLTGGVNDDDIIEVCSYASGLLNESIKAFDSQTFFTDIFPEHDSVSISFYFSRVSKTILTNLIDNEPLLSFEKWEINFNKLMRTPLKLATLLISCKQYITLPKFDRIRNGVASELIGLKNDEIVSKGLQFFTLLNNFLLCDSSSYQVEKFIPFPEQRLNMLFREWNKYLESDIAYEDEFIPIRIQLIIFTTNYISLSQYSELLDITKLLNIGFSLFRDSIGIATLEQENELLKDFIVPLRYFSLKLFVLLSKNKDDIEAWDEDIDGIYEELVESLVSGNTGKVLNQPSILTYDLYYKIFDNLVPLKFVKIEDISQLLDSHPIVQKLAVMILDKLILEHQQDYLIEYELNKSKISASEDTENLYAAKIPQFLIDNVSVVPEEYLEYEDTHKMNKFLWSWYLIFDHFKNITQRMRHDYIKQLKPEFQKFFQFIFDQIDLNSDMNLIKKLAQSDEIKDYQISNIIDSSVEEQKQLIIHLYYLSFANVGSLVQMWFHTIRDRQLKNSIEKFSINYISPIVIEDELNKAADLILKNTVNDENLTIKINRVTREIKSLYLIDEKTMEMVIKIPSSYPLLNVVVDGPVRLGVKETQWKSWLLASQRIITSQNSTIIGAIELFNKNVSLHFSGFEECAICYSILHYQDNSLPSKTCTTCNNKFHAGCLYKWFKSSGGSTCPLCRSTFNFRK